MSDDPREPVALACRVLARAGLLEDVLGHVSVRLDAGSMLVRCRGPLEHGLLFTEPQDVHEVPIHEAPAPLPDGYRPPLELPIHAALYRARPDVRAVVHAHPRSALLAGLAGLELRPVFGSYNIPAARLALAGVPVFPRAALIGRDELAQELLAAMGGADVCLMRGHGITTCGETLDQAVTNALALETLTSVTVGLAQLGAVAPELTAADVAELPDLGPGLNERFTLAYHAALDAEARSRAT
jgi:ribulose-5-phosphate 4-epimerase/fuculose-1-phosphate aldolase